MTLKEIAMTAKPKQQFQNGTDDNICFFDDYGRLCFFDIDDEEAVFSLIREELVSNDWHFI